MAKKWNWPDPTLFIEKKKKSNCNISFAAYVSWFPQQQFQDI